MRQLPFVVEVHSQAEYAVVFEWLRLHGFQTHHVPTGCRHFPTCIRVGGKWCGNDAENSVGLGSKATYEGCGRQVMSYQAFAWQMLTDVRDLVWRTGLRPQEMTMRLPVVVEVTTVVEFLWVKHWLHQYGFQTDINERSFPCCVRIGGQWGDEAENSVGTGSRAAYSEADILNFSRFACGAYR